MKKVLVLMFTVTMVFCSQEFVIKKKQKKVSRKSREQYCDAKVEFLRLNSQLIHKSGLLQTMYVEETVNESDKSKSNDTIIDHCKDLEHLNSEIKKLVNELEKQILAFRSM